MRAKEISPGIWNVKRGDRSWTGRAKDAADARAKAADMWLGR